MLGGFAIAMLTIVSSIFVLCTIYHIYRCYIEETPEYKERKNREYYERTQYLRDRPDYVQSRVTGDPDSSNGVVQIVIDISTQIANDVRNTQPVDQNYPGYPNSSSSE